MILLKALRLTKAKPTTISSELKATSTYKYAASKYNVGSACYILDLHLSGMKKDRRKKYLWEAIGGKEDNLWTWSHLNEFNTLDVLVKSILSLSVQNANLVCRKVCIIYL